MKLIDQDESHATDNHGTSFDLRLALHQTRLRKALRLSKGNWLVTCLAVLLAILSHPNSTKI